MPTCTVVLNTDQARFVDDCVRRLGYMNASAVVRAGLELLERQTKVAANAGPLGAGGEPPAWSNKAADLVVAMRRHFEDRDAFDDRITALVDESVRSGAYPCATDALEDLVAYVEMRFTFVKPPPGRQHLRLTPKPAD